MNTRLAPPHPTESMTVKGRKSWSALGIFIAELPELFAWYTGMTFTGLNIRIRETDVLFVVKADSKAGPRVTFYTVRDVVTGYRLLYHELHTGSIHWRVDKYK